MQIFNRSFKAMAPMALVLFAFASVKAQPADFQKINFKKADSVASLYPKYFMGNLYDLSMKLTEPLDTDVEKFRSIYTWVSTNIENDYSYYKKNKIKREKLQNSPNELKEWEDKFGPMVFEKLRKEYKTVCTGYAYLVKEMAVYAGIDCKIVDGYGRTVQANIGGEGIANHSWNAVKLNNKWYLCDPTWSSGAINVQEGRFIKNYDDAYFLASPDLFVQSHYPLDSAWLLLDDKPTLQQYLNRPLVYKAAYRYKVISIYPDTFITPIKKGTSISFKWKQVGEYKLSKAELQIVQGSTSTSVIPQLHLTEDNTYGIEHEFDHTGTYVVHVLLDGDYTFTYTVKVSK